jgi:hydrogenase expression/formation protein HypE
MRQMPQRFKRCRVGWRRALKKIGLKKTQADDVLPYNDAMTLPLGKLPPDRLARLLQQIAVRDPSVLLGPGIGRDCAVIEFDGDQLLVAKSDPITFATDEIGWYAVQVNANDLATTGATPRWFLSTVLLPQSIASEAIDQIFDQMRAACADVGATIIGGHTEVTYDLTHPIVLGSLLGTVARDRLITPMGAQPGDAIVLTKRLAVEATSIMAREKAEELRLAFDEAFLQRCRRFLHEPGISVLRDAQIALRAGHVHAMHDPTEGGVATALNEMAVAAQVNLQIDRQAVPIYPDTQILCDYFDLDPWGVIASGSLLLAVEAAGADRAVKALREDHIEATVIGRVIDRSDQPIVLAEIEGRSEPLRSFERDEITKLF